jgi:hypothetical protein
MLPEQLTFLIKKWIPACAEMAALWLAQKKKLLRQ